MCIVVDCAFKMLFYFENENDFGYNIEINWEKGGELERNINCSFLINFTLFCASVSRKNLNIENTFYVFKKTIFNELRKTSSFFRFLVRNQAKLWWNPSENAREIRLVQ